MTRTIRWQCLQENCVGVIKSRFKGRGFIHDEFTNELIAYNVRSRVFYEERLRTGDIVIYDIFQNDNNEFWAKRIALEDGPRNSRKLDWKRINRVI